MAGQSPYIAWPDIVIRTHHLTYTALTHSPTGIVVTRVYITQRVTYSGEVSWICTTRHPGAGDKELVHDTVHETKAEAVIQLATELGISPDSVR